MINKGVESSLRRRLAQTALGLVAVGASLVAINMAFPGFSDEDSESEFEEESFEEKEFSEASSLSEENTVEDSEWEMSFWDFFAWTIFLLCFFAVFDRPVQNYDFRSEDPIVMRPFTKKFESEDMAVKTLTYFSGQLEVVPLSDDIMGMKNEGLHTKKSESIPQLAAPKRNFHRRSKNMKNERKASSSSKARTERNSAEDEDAEDPNLIWDLWMILICMVVLLGITETRQEDNISSSKPFDVDELFRKNQLGFGAHEESYESESLQEAEWEEEEEDVSPGEKCLGLAFLLGAIYGLENREEEFSSEEYEESELRWSSEETHSEEGDSLTAAKQWIGRLEEENADLKIKPKFD